MREHGAAFLFYGVLSMLAMGRKHPYGFNHRGVVSRMLERLTVDVELGIERSHNPKNCIELWVVFVPEDGR